MQILNRFGLEVGEMLSGNKFLGGSSGLFEIMEYICGLKLEADWSYWTNWSNLVKLVLLVPFLYAKPNFLASAR